MSTGMVSNAKKELAERGLITIEKRYNEDGGLNSDLITIVDIWLKNFIKYAPSSHSEPPPSPGEHPTPPHEDPLSPGESKKNPINNNPPKKELKTPRAEPRGPGAKKPPAGDGDKGTPKPGSDVYQIAAALADVCGMVLSKNPRLFREAKKFTVSEIPTILADYGRDGPWYSRDWRGKQGEMPRPELIRETWGQLHANGNGHAPAPEPEPDPVLPPTPVYKPAHPVDFHAQENFYGAVDRLKAEVGKAAALTYLDGLEFADYDPKRKEYVAAHYNGFTVDWLRANAGAKISALLAGASIRFVVGEVGG